MEMSLDYMRETARELGERGFALREEAVVLGESDAGPVEAVRFHLERAPEERLTLETVLHPAEGERYFLELHAWHGLRAHSFPLDSWKHRPDRVELKFYALDATGLGLAFVLETG